MTDSFYLYGAKVILIKIALAFFEYMVSNGFYLKKGLPKEETNREHYTVKEYKNITNFEKTKET